MYLVQGFVSNAVFTKLRFLSKTSTFLSVLASRLHQNDENAYLKWRLLNPDIKIEVSKMESKNDGVNSENVNLSEYKSQSHDCDTR